jgi:5-methyltetrahydropteroyltriglutamate--homocysteine methyltransferase
MKTHLLGYPRIGKQRELKFLLESYWQGQVTESDFLAQAKALRQQHWQQQLNAGIEVVTVGDFAHYDHILTTSLRLGVVPKRFQQLSGLELEFAIARGQTQCCEAHGASDMTKWFNTNYHYLVPELTADTVFNLNIDDLLQQIDEAKALSNQVKPVIVGPVTYLYLSHFEPTSTSPNALVLLPKLLKAYQALLQQLADKHIEWVQIDEPILTLELDDDWQQALIECYQQLSQSNINCLLASYFGAIDHQLPWLNQLAIDGIHLDLVSEPTVLTAVLQQLPAHWLISLGVINGRNVFKTDLVNCYQQLQPVISNDQRKFWIAPSCSLLHCPYDIKQETQLDTELASWLAFAEQKCEELHLLKTALTEQSTQKITHYSAAALARLVSSRIHNPRIQQQLAQLNSHDFKRQSPYSVREALQKKKLKLPLLPTTTIGSFPQTSAIRQCRAKWRKQQLSDHDYIKAMQQEIADTINKQQQLGLDVLVHGEPERNDMVEYFAEYLDGFLVTKQAWVQSYGSRCVKPPIIFGDIERPKAITVEWITYAQSLTNKPVKGMLTGPITLLSWSFVRDDIELSQVAQQLALAVREEVADLQENNINIIQIDEPAIRERLPLKKSQWSHYFDWATKAFRLASSAARDETQIHSHLCYSQFEDVYDAIVQLDVDVLTVETSRSNKTILQAFKHYPNALGPGVYDIHSPNVPDKAWIRTLLKQAAEFIPWQRLWVNPDCGLKTRQWPETLQSLENMVTVARELRETLSVNVATD